MKYIIFGAFVTIGVALINFLKSLKDNKKANKENSTITILFLFALGGALSTMFSGIESKNDAKRANDSLTIKQKTIDSLTTKISSAQDTSLALQKKEIDSIRDLLRSAVTIIGLQQEVKELQGNAFDVITGGNNWEDAFTTFVLIDEKTHLPTSTFLNLPDPSLQRIQKRQRAFRSAAQPIGGFGTNQFAAIKMPKNVGETQSFLIELMEYKILLDIFETGYQVEGIQYSAEGTKGYMQQRYPLKRSRRLTKDEMRKLLIRNQFAQDIMQWTSWESGGIRTPPGTEIYTTHLPIGTRGGEKRIITLKKRNFFEVNIIIEHSFQGNIGVLPANVYFEPYADLNNSLPYYLNTVIKSNFTPTSNPEIIEYKKWIRHTIDQIVYLNQD